MMGFAGRKLFQPGEEADRSGVESRSATKSEREASSAPVSSTLYSTDTLEDLLEDESSAQFGRIALWLLDATPGEVAQLWEGLTKTHPHPQGSLQLVMMKWAQMDPTAAMAAAVGTQWENLAWASWAEADPRAAIAAVGRDNSIFASTVLRAIGTVDPELALQLMKEYPEAVSSTSIEGIAEGLAKIDPQRGVEFALSHRWVPVEALRSWARSDPDEFLQWCAQSGVGGSRRIRVREALEVLVREHPERIAELVNSISPGQLRHDLLKAGVRRLAGSDVDAALALVAEAPATVERSDLYASLGEALAETDPDRSLQLLQGAAAYETSRQTLAVYPDGSFISVMGQAHFGNWLRALGAVRPVETLEVVHERYPEMRGNVTYGWMNRDPDGFAVWLRDEPPSQARQRDVESLVRTLTLDGEIRFAEALHWAVQVEDVHDRQRGISEVVESWSREESPEVVQAFLASPDAPEGARESYEAYRKRQEEE